MDVENCHGLESKMEIEREMELIHRYFTVNGEMEKTSYLLPVEIEILTFYLK